MPALTVKNVPDKLYDQLKVSAQAHHRSINGEVIHCLESSLRPRRMTPQETIAAARVLRRRVKAEQISLSEIDAAKNKGWS